MIRLVALISLAVLAYLITLWRLISMDATVRQRAPGEFATLSDGITHYHWHGHLSDPV
ncbi:MAG: hypothetical protein AAED33_10740 [Paracoccaceae bacterium]